MRGLWLCFAALVCLGAPARAQSLSVGDLIADCKAGVGPCADDFMSSDIALSMLPDACAPQDILLVQDEILAWIERHPDEQTLDASTAAADAVDALWPCGAGN